MTCNNCQGDDCMSMTCQYDDTDLDWYDMPDGTNTWRDGLK